MLSQQNQESQIVRHKTKKIKYGPIGETVAKRSYLKPKKLSIYHRCSDASLEKWEELCYRVAMGNMDFVPQTYSTQEAQALYDALLNMKILLGGRHLSNTGIKNREFIGNCYASLWKWSVPAQHFTFSFEREMEGGGMGCNYSDRYFENAAVMHKQKYHMIVNKDHKDFQELKAIGVIAKDSARAPKTDMFTLRNRKVQYHEIGDSREGWSEAIEVLINSLFAEKKVLTIFDFSKIRPKGSPLKAIGGEASGPAPLAKTFQSIISYAFEHSGEKFDWWAGFNFDHWVAEAVMAGGFRRCARMSVKHWKDVDIFRFINSKKDGFSHWTTNLSVIVDSEFFEQMASGDTHAVAVWEQVIDGMFRNGEPGFAYWDLINIGEKEEVFSLNACVTGDTQILTSKGELPIKELVGKAVDVWNGEEWSKVIPEFTGMKQCYLVVLSNGGTLTCSWNHEFILEDGSRIKANKLKVGDSLKVFGAQIGVKPPDKNGTITVEQVIKKSGAKKTYCFNEPKLHQGTFNGIVTGQCGEFGLGPGEFCNTGHINLARVDSIEDAYKMAEICAKALLRANFSQLNMISRHITEENQRIGVGIMGLQHFSCSFGIKYTQIAGNSTMRKFFTDLYKVVRKTADDFADRIGCNRPVKVTTIAPTGSVGQVAGATTGCQCIVYKWYTRRIRFQEGNEQLEQYRQAGYTVEIDEAEPRLGRIVCVPMQDPLIGMFPESLVEDQTDVTLEQALSLQAFLQEVWADNSISFTVNFDPKLVDKAEFEKTMLKYIKRLKGTTVFPECHNFKQPPYTKLTKDEYMGEIAKLKQIIHGGTSEIERMCASGSCEVIL